MTMFVFLFIKYNEHALAVWMDKTPMWEQRVDVVVAGVATMRLEGPSDRSDVSFLRLLHSCVFFIPACPLFLRVLYSLGIPLVLASSLPRFLAEARVQRGCRDRTRPAVSHALVEPTT